MRLRHGTWLVMTGMLWGCTMMNGTPPPASSPLFQADAIDTAILQTVQREQDTKLSACAQSQTCDQAHFTRAMISLFENGETAATSFQQAIAAAPNGPFAESSARWLRFLANRTFYPGSADEPTDALREVMKGLVRAWLEQQRPASAPITVRAEEPAKIPDPSVQALQRKIRDREKRIAELTDQLNALKQIDMDAKGTGKLNLPRASSK